MEGGWRIVGWDPTVNQMIDLLAGSHQHIQNAKSCEDDSLLEGSVEEAIDGAENSTLLSLNRRIHRTLKRLYEHEEDFDLPLWDQSLNENFFQQQFFMHSFSPFERDHREVEQTCDRQR